MKNIDYSKTWKVLDSEYLIKRPWLTARRDHLLLPDGREIPEYYVLEYPDWVNVIAITKDGHFVMERQYRHALGCTCYELPCGVMEEGETPLEAAQRLATGVEKAFEQHLDATEELEVHLLTREEVCYLLRNNEMMQSLMVASLLKYLSLELI